MPNGEEDADLISLIAALRASIVLKFIAGIAPVIPDFKASMIIFGVDTKNIGAIIIG